MRNKRCVNKNWKKRWREVVKQDFDFDWGFMFDILLRKIDLMLAYYAGRDNCVQADSSRLPIARELVEVSELGHKLQNEDYYDPFDEYCASHPAQVHVDEKTGTRVYQRSEEECAEMRKIMEDCRKAQDEDAKRFFGMIAENYLKWWD